MSAAASLPVRPLSTRPPEAQRELQRLGEGHYLLAIPTREIALEVTRVRRDRFGELRADLDVHCGIAGAQSFEGILDAFANFPLSHARQRTEAARLLQAKARVSSTEIDLAALLNELHLRVRRALLDGDRAVCLPDVPRPPADDTLTVDGLPLLKRLPNLWAAPGGAGKSTMMVYIAGRLYQQGVKVAVVDYEMEAADHRPRLEALFGADMPRIVYVRATQPLVYEIERIARIGHEHAIDFWCVDSAGPASLGPLKDEEGAVGFFRALRTLNRGSLTLAHVAKQQAGADDPKNPFGSVFWSNLARSVWQLKVADAASDSSTLTVGFFHRKANTSRLHSPIGFELVYDTNSIRVRRVDLAAVEGLAAQLPIRQRIAHLLKSGPRTIPEIATELETRPDTVKRTINRYASGNVVIFSRVPHVDGVDRIALAETRRQP